MKNVKCRCQGYGKGVSEPYLAHGSGRVEAKSMSRSNASVQLSRHVGFTPDSGRIAARQRTDASGQSRPFVLRKKQRAFSFLTSAAQRDESGSRGGCAVNYSSFASFSPLMDRCFLSEGIEHLRQAGARTTAWCWRIAIEKVLVFGESDAKPMGYEREFQCGFLSFEGSIPARPCADRCATGKCQPCLIAMKRRPKHKAPPASAETP